MSGDTCFEAMIMFVMVGQIAVLKNESLLAFIFRYNCLGDCGVSETPDNF
jgi:hypothetical protein